MKLCRFDLASSPGTARTGIAYEGKVYETQGAEPIGVHDWTEARLLSPVGQPPSFRLFSTLPTKHETEAFEFRYLNPNVIAGPLGIISVSPGLELSCIPCLGAVVAGGGASIPIAQADEVLLGLTLVNVFFQSSENPIEQLPAWAFDAGSSVGPALTTPDELDETVIDESIGRRYDFEVSLAVNGDEVFKVNVETMGATIAQLLSFASLTSPVKQGDLFAAALISPLPEIKLKGGDQVRLVSEKLGALVTNLA